MYFVNVACIETIDNKYNHQSYNGTVFVMHKHAIVTELVLYGIDVLS